MWITFMHLLTGFKRLSYQRLCTTLWITLVDIPMLYPSYPLACPQLWRTTYV